jgi:hypothetical protein
MPMKDVFDTIWREAAANVRELRRLVGVWGSPLPVPDWMAPAVAFGALLTLALAAGVALASIATLLSALLAAHLVLTEILGISLVVTVPANWMAGRTA